MRILVASAAVGLLVAPGLARAGSGTGGDGNDDAQMIADARRTLHAAVIAYDNKKWDEMRALFTEDAVAMQRSVTKLAELDFEIAVFGHGSPIRGGASGEFRTLAAKLARR